MRPPTDPESARRRRRITRLGRELVNGANAFLRTARLHEPNNQAFRQTLGALTAASEALWEEDPRVRLEVSKDLLFVNEVRLRPDATCAASYRSLALEFSRRGIGGLVIEQGCTESDLTALGLIWRDFEPTTEDLVGELNEKLQVLELYPQLQFTQQRFIVDQEEDTIGNPREFALQVYGQAVSYLRGLPRQVVEGKKVSARRAKRLVQSFVDLSARRDFNFAALSTIKDYDEYTYSHSVNVSVLCISFGQRLGLRRSELVDLGMAGLFHDVGKLAVPINILNKPGKFDDTEWELMKRHSVKGFLKLIAMPEFGQAHLRRAIVAFEHHCDYDLGGYPRKSNPRPLHLFSRICAIADTYDAMTSKRIYQSAFSPDQAIKILLERSGKKYDPLLARAFINALGVYPVGTVVVLDSGEVGVVWEAAEFSLSMDRPRIKLIGRSADDPVRGTVVDLTDKSPSGRFARSILHPADPSFFGIDVARFLLSELEAEQTQEIE